jgi:hypothetical protein
VRGVVRRNDLRHVTLIPGPLHVAILEAMAVRSPGLLCGMQTKTTERSVTPAVANSSRNLSTVSSRCGAPVWAASRLRRCGSPGRNPLGLQGAGTHGCRETLAHEGAWSRALRLIACTRTGSRRGFELVMPR